MSGSRIYRKFERACMELKDIPVLFIGNNDRVYSLSKRDREIIACVRNNGIEDFAGFVRLFAEKYNVRENSIYRKIISLHNILTGKKLIFDDIKNDGQIIDMNKTQLQPVTFGQAKCLKTLGFDWTVYHWYNSDKSLSTSIDRHDRNTNERGISAPFASLALKWMRDVKRIACNVEFWRICDSDVTIYEGVWYVGNGRCYTKPFDTYEAAESELLNELLLLKR